MQAIVAKVLKRIKEAYGGEEGTDLIEYALLIHFIAFGATAGSMPLAKSIGGVFDTVSSGLASAVANSAPSGGSAAGAGSRSGGGHGHGGSGSGEGSGD